MPRNKTSYAKHSSSSFVANHVVRDLVKDSRRIERVLLAHGHEFPPVAVEGPPPLLFPLSPPSLLPLLAQGRGAGAERRLQFRWRQLVIHNGRSGWQGDALHGGLLSRIEKGNGWQTLAHLTPVR